MIDDFDNTGGSKQPVLLVCADDLYSVLDDHLGDRIRLIQVADAAGADMAFKEERPVLLILGLDEDGPRFNPLLRTAAAHDIPVMTVAASEDALTEIEGTKWSVDRNRHGAVVSLTNNILDDSSYVPNNPTLYPPPPKAPGGVSRNSGTDIQRVQVVSVGNARRTPSPAGPLGDPLIQRLEKDIMSAFQKAIDNSAEQYKQQSLLLVDMQKRIETLEQKTQVMTTDLGEIINAVAQDGAVFQAEITERVTTLSARNNSVGSNLTEMIDAVSATNTSSIEEVRAALNGIMAQLRGSGGTGGDEHFERPSEPSAPDFTSQFEDLWDTQTILSKLQERLTHLENQSAVAESRAGETSVWEGELRGVTRAQTVAATRIDSVEKRLETVGTNMAQLQETQASLLLRLSALDKALADQAQRIPDFNTYIQGFQRTHAKTEARLNGLEEAIATVMHTPPEVNTRLERIQATQANILQRLNLMEKVSEKLSSVPPSADDSKQPLTTIRKWERTEKRLAALESSRQEAGAAAKTAAPDTALRAQVTRLEEMQSLLLNKMQQLKSQDSRPPTPDTKVNQPDGPPPGTAAKTSSPQDANAEDGRITNSSLTPRSKSVAPPGKKSPAKKAAAEKPHEGPTDIGKYKAKKKLRNKK